MSWTIRPARPQDAELVAALGGALFRQTYEETHPEPVLSRYLAESFGPAHVAATLARADTTILLVEGRDASLIGYAHLRVGAPATEGTQLDAPLPGSAPLEIVRFYVDASWHGQGIAQALMAACDREAEARGCDVLWLQAWQEAARALAFYRKAGFRVGGTAVFMFGDRRDSDFLLVRPVARRQRAHAPAVEPPRT